MGMSREARWSWWWEIVMVGILILCIYPAYQGLKDVGEAQRTASPLPAMVPVWIPTNAEVRQPKEVSSLSAAITIPTAEFKARFPSGGIIVLTGRYFYTWNRDLTNGFVYKTTQFLERPSSWLDIFEVDQFRIAGVYTGSNSLIVMADPKLIPRLSFLESFALLFVMCLAPTLVIRLAWRGVRWIMPRRVATA